ncbi:MAG: rod shape-determining protein [Minisyncoccia bacterium]
MLLNFKKFLGFDIGTARTSIYLKGKGIIVNEPSIVAFNNRTNRIIAVGKEAKKMLSRTPSHISAVRPITHGVVADFDLVKEMINRFLAQEKIGWHLSTTAIVAIPTNLTEVERKSAEDLLKETGATTVYLIEKPLAAALGSRLDISVPTAYLIVDIGAGTTDIAVVSMNGVVISNRLKVAGDYLNQQIIDAVKDELKLVIGEPTAEEIKIAVGSAVPLNEKLEFNARGRDLTSGLPQELIIKDSQVRLWIQKSLKVISESIRNLIEETPAELVGDIYKNGIYLSGGGSLLRGIDQFLQKDLGVNVSLIDDPLNCVIRGTGLITERFEDYNNLLESSSLVHTK